MKFFVGCFLLVIVVIDRIEVYCLVSGYSNVNVGVLIFGRELFCDFGDNFVVNDVDGEEFILNMVVFIIKVR